MKRKRELETNRFRHDKIENEPGVKNSIASHASREDEKRSSKEMPPTSETEVHSVECEEGKDGLSVTNLKRISVENMNLRNIQALNIQSKSKNRCRGYAIEKAG